MEIDLTDIDTLNDLETLVEQERKRLQGWAFKEDMEKYKEINVFRCRRLAAIRENLRELKESYV